MELNSEWAQVEVIDLINDGSGLAFGIVGGRSTGVVVKSILPGGIADRDNRLQSGDHILQIGGINLRGLGSEQVASILRQCGVHVRIMVAREVDATSPSYQPKLNRNSAIVPTRILGDPDELETYLVRKGYESFYQQIVTNGFSSTITKSDEKLNVNRNHCSGFVNVIKSPKTPLSLNSSIPIIEERVPSPSIPETEYFTVRLQKNDLGLGITVAGYVCEKEDISGVFVKSVTKGSAADLCKKIRVNDRIVKVDSVSLIGLSNQKAINILKTTGQITTLSFERFLSGPKYDQLQQIIKANEKHPISSLISSPIKFTRKNPNAPIRKIRNVKSCSYGLVKAKSESSLPILNTEYEYSNLIKRSKSVELVSAVPLWRDVGVNIQIKKSQYGLGFSVLDYQDPLNPSQSVIVIRSLIPGGVAQTDGRLKPGDRLLAVNNINLQNANLNRAVQVLKSVPEGLVNITVAKPIPSNDTSFSSQETEEDENTYLDEFQECLDDYQDLVGVEVCLDEDSSLTQSPYHSIIDEVCERKSFHDNSEHLNEFSASKDLSVNKLNENKVLSYEQNLLEKLIKRTSNENASKLKSRKFDDKLLQKPSDYCRDCESVSPIPEDTDRDAYDTCIEDSFSEKVRNSSWSDLLKKSRQISAEHDNHGVILITSSSLSSLHSEPELDRPGKDIFKDNHHHITLSSKIEDDLNTFNGVLDAFGSDDFFLMQFIDEEKPLISNNTFKYKSEPTLNQFNFFGANNNRKHIKINEYYNDYADCLDAYFLHSKSNVAENSEENNSNNIVVDKLSSPLEYHHNFRCETNEAKPKSIALNSFSDSLVIELTEEFSRINLLTLKHRIKSSSLTCFYSSAGTKNDFKEVSDIKTKRRYSLQNVVDNDVILFSSSLTDKDYQPQDNLRSRQNLQNTVSKSKKTIEDVEEREDMLEKHWGDVRHVKVYRENNQSLGISIVGGKVKVDINSTQDASSSVMGIFIKNVVPFSPAGRTGEFKTGDRILEVSGVDLRRASHEKAIDAIKNAPNPITFVLQSLVPWTGNNPNNTFVDKNSHTDLVKPEVKLRKSVKYKDKPNEHSSEEKNYSNRESIRKVGGSFKNKMTQLKSSLKKREGQNVSKNGEVAQIATNSVNKVESSSDSEEEEDVRELEGRTVSAKGHEIDRASAANVKRTKEEIAADTEEEDDFGYTSKKISKKYANLGHTVKMIKLERSPQGLGLSLAGHKNRNRMAVFVCGLNPNGAAFRVGEIKVGDEILEVNGIVLHGRCHLNASAIIKGLSGPVFKIIILRRKEAIDDIAVRPITQFPVTLQDETPEEKYANFPNLRVISIKKGTQSLGIMIIEGKHADVGQGIFISDIQEGSAAEKAGLEIGEMILAVNKDSLVGSNYNEAATLLKQSEGLVTLVVSNPGKKEDTAKSDPQKPPTPEPPADPATCPIKPGKEITIEINAENKALGLCFVGGTDTPIKNSIVIVDVYKGGAAAKDGRLQPGDQIIDSNGTPLKDVTYLSACQILRQILPKIKLIVYRPENIEYTTVDVELVKKPGKGLGLSLAPREQNQGTYVTEILCGGLADTDGKISKGDLLISVNDHKIDSASAAEAATVLKTVMGKMVLKLHRYKPKV